MCASLGSCDAVCVCACIVQAQQHDAALREAQRQLKQQTAAAGAASEAAERCRCVVCWGGGGAELFRRWFIGAERPK